MFELKVNNISNTPANDFPVQFLHFACISTLHQGKFSNPSSTIQNIVLLFMHR